MADRDGRDQPSEQAQGNKLKDTATTRLATPRTKAAPDAGAAGGIAGQAMSGLRGRTPRGRA